MQVMQVMQVLIYIFIPNDFQGYPLLMYKRSKLNLIQSTSISSLSSVTLSPSSCP